MWIQKFQRAPGGEFGGDLLAEGFGCCAERGFVEDLGDLFAVGGDDHRVEVPDVVDELAISAEGELAAAAEGVEDGALGLGGVLGGGAVEGADDGVDGGVALRVRRG